MSRALVDGRVFSVSPDGSQAEYFRRLAHAMSANGDDVALLMFDDCLLDAADPLFEQHRLRFAPFAGAEPGDGSQMHAFTHYLTCIISAGRFDAYVDASVFIGPMRIEIPNAATLAVAMSLPLISPHHSDSQITAWRNAWLRLDRSDAIICASACDREALFCYLGATAHRIFDFAEAGSADCRELGKGLSHARAQHLEWRQKAALQVFSSLPGSYCGIADYTTAHLRDFAGACALHFSEGDPSRLAHLPAKLFTYLDFDCVGSLTGAQRVYHLAASRALLPGLELMRRSARKGDIAVVHERRFMEAFEYLMETEGKKRLLGSAYYRSDADADAFARRALGIASEDEPFGEFSSWLSECPVALASPLSPASKTQHNLYQDLEGKPARNEFKAIEPRIAFVPLGMDERAMPDIRRAAQRIRASHGIPGHGLVLGHFGQVVDHHRLLREAADALLAIGKKSGWAVGQRPIFLLFSGRIGDAQLVQDIQRLFADAGVTDRLIFTQPQLEESFDAHMKACDAAICFRLQAWGHQSNAQIRALALGVPALVNSASGWGYDPQITIEDEDLEAGLCRAIKLLADPITAARKRHAARTEFEQHHRAQEALTQMLAIGKASAPTHQAH